MKSIVARMIAFQVLNCLVKLPIEEIKLVRKVMESPDLGHENVLRIRIS